MNAVALVLTVFVACSVEAVEALTIVLAAGLTREWRSTFQGMAVALVVLAVVVAVAGPALTLFPLGALRLVVGALLAVFGLQWLRKGILRASGYKGLHDETSIYERQVAAARAAASPSLAAAWRMTSSSASSERRSRSRSSIRLIATSARATSPAMASRTSSF